jgi:hypothetical protein
MLVKKHFHLFSAGSRLPLMGAFSSRQLVNTG